MPLRQYLIFATTATVCSWIGWLIVIYYLNPEAAGLVGLSLFYVTLFLALLGTFALIGFFARVWFSKEQAIFRHLGVSTRQSLWLALLAVFALMLQASDMYRWWSLLLLIVLLSLLELFFISRKVATR